MAIGVGSRLGPYEILSVVGSGGMGQVWKARDSRLAREVAIKVLPERFAADPDRLRRFEQEARAAGALNHPNVVVIHDIGTYDGSPYVVEELLRGSILRDRLAASRLSVNKSLDYSLQIAKGLAAAHEKGIVHRDVKPENLFVTTDGVVKILDFGLAKLARPEESTSSSTVSTNYSGTQPGAVLGTVAYMSPEQARGLPVDARTDIFSLGSVLYEMLSGKRPFIGASAVDVMSAILNDDPLPLSNHRLRTSTDLERLVSHCLEKIPDDRFQSARDLAYDLENVFDKPGVENVRLSSAASPSESPRMRAALVASIAAACVLAALLVGHFVWKPSRTSPPLFRRLTYRRGAVNSARFAPDGQTVVYSAQWEGQPSQIYLKRPESSESLLIDLPSSVLLSVSRAGEIALLLNCAGSPGRGSCTGTLAVAPLTGGSPRPLYENVTYADYSADGKSFLLVRRNGEHTLLEFPAGRTLFETTGNITYPRLSPKGDRICFIDNPASRDDRGSVAVIDLAGKKRTLSRLWASARGTAWSASGEEVWFSANDSNDRQLRAVSLSGQERLVVSVPLGTEVRDILPDGRVLLTPETSSTRLIVQASDAERERDFTWYGHSIASDLSVDGKSVLFVGEGEAFGPTYATCLRRLDGSPPVRLGEGIAQSLSNDGRLVLSQLPTKEASSEILPTGAGNPRILPNFALRRSGTGTFFPDGRRILFTASEVGREARMWIQDIDGGRPRPATPEGVLLPYAFGCQPVAPDGKRFFALDARGRLVVFSIDGGSPILVPSFQAATERLVRWSSDGASIFFIDGWPRPNNILKIDVPSGRRTVWKEFPRLEPAGMTNFVSFVMTADGRGYAYTIYQLFSELYTVTGLT